MALLAGFLFVGLVYLLTEQRHRHSGETFMLFLASFVCLAAGSYVATIVSGEVSCLRAWSESMISSGLVAVGAVAMLCALTWLLPEQYARTTMVRRFAFACVLLVTMVVVELLTTSARGFLLDMPGWRQWRALAVWYLPLGIVLVACAFAARHAGTSGTAPLSIAGRIQRRVGIAAVSVIGLALVSLAALGPIGDRPADLWQRPASWVVVLSVLVPLGGAAIVLPLLMWSLPTKETWSNVAAQAAGRQ